MAKVAKKGNSFGLILLVLLAAFGIASYFYLQKPYCANSISCEESFNLKVENGAIAKFGNQNIDAPTVDVNEQLPQDQVLGEATVEGDKRILVDLTTQTLTAYQGDVEMFSAMVSTGKWFETPTGDFKIWLKLRSTRMTGGEGADYYDLPNVPYVMFFYNDQIPKARGFGFHGAYWHNNFGHPMSHGCINMRAVDAQKLYEWADMDTNVTITGIAP